MWFDRFLLSVSPERAARRAEARLKAQRLSALYEGAGNTRRTRGWRAYGTGPNAEIQPSLAMLRARSRDLVRNNPFAAAGLDITVSYQVGAGIVPRSTTKDADTDRQVDELFAAWAAKADIGSRTDFYGLQALLARSRAEAGEGLGLLVSLSSAEARRRSMAVPLALQVLEPDHLDETREAPAAGGKPRVRQGIAVTDGGAPVTYYLRVEHPGEANGPFSAAAGMEREVAAARMVHVYRADRPGQLRGVPDLAPVMTRLRSLDELEDAALEQAKIQACLAAFVTSPAQPSAGPLEGTDLDTGDQVKSFYPGMVERLLPGEGVEFATPSGAGGFSDLARHQLHAIATGWGLTYDLLTGDLSQANYSSLRAGRLAFKRRLERTQWHVLIPQFQRIWDAFIAAALVAGVLPPREGGYPCEWAPPVFEMVDPLKDALAFKEMQRLGGMTWGQFVAQQGWDPHRQAEEIAKWNKVHDDLGLILDGDPRRTGGAGGAQDVKANAAIEIAATGAATDQPAQPAP